MPKSCIVDSGALVALLDPREEHHAWARHPHRSSICNASLSGLLSWARATPIRLCWCWINPRTGWTGQDNRPCATFCLSASGAAPLSLASHKVTEVERICDTVGIIKAGKIITEAAVENNPRIIIIAIPRSGTEAPLKSGSPFLAKELKSLHPLVRITGGSNSGPLVLSLPAGDQAVNPQGIKARALRVLVDSSLGRDFGIRRA